MRYALRMLAKSPGITIVAVISLALGIGANTSIFSLINALMLRPLPVRDPQQLVAVSTIRPGSENPGLSLAMFQEIQKRQQVFSGMFAWTGDAVVNLETNGVKYAGVLAAVTGDYYSAVGVQPFLGRLIGSQDLALESGSPAPVAVLDYRCWRLRYNGDPSVLGKTIVVDGQPLTIIGVTPARFAGLIIDSAADVTVPVGYSGRTAYRERKNLPFDVMARLKPGVSLAQARAQLQALWPGVREAALPDYDPVEWAHFYARRIEVESAATGTSYMRERLSRPLTVLMGLVGAVLLIACVNLANLMLARASGRRQELGIRLALGAGAWRLIRQLLVESLLLTGAGSVLGFAIAFWASRLLLNTQWSGYVPSAIDPTPDLRVLVFTATTALFTGVLFGLAPAWSIFGIDPASALQHNLRTMRTGGGLFGKLLASAQIAVSLILVIGALLFVRSLDKLHSADLGFQRQGILLMHSLLQGDQNATIPNRTAYFRRVVEEMSAIPGVESVSYSNLGPGFPSENNKMVSRPSASAGPAQAAEELIGPGFFQTMGMRLRTGREFKWTDDEHAPRVAIISESLARSLFPGENPIGRKLDGEGRKGLEIVGVVNNASLWSPRSHEPPAFYIPFLQEPTYNQPMFEIRTAGDPYALARPAERTLESLGRHYSLRTQTLKQRLDWTLRNERLMAKLSSFFGGLALLLASVGLYGLMSHAVTRRTGEIGIRMALGAGRPDVLRLILKEVTMLTLSGIAVGVPVALAASRLISGMLFDLPANDPGTIAASVAILSAVALFAGYLPARRASRIDPMAALRQD